MIIFREGNILEAKENIICHQVNCLGVMGSGLAKQIREKWPNVYSEYCDYVKFYRENGITLLGRTQFIPISGTQYICNIFGQEFYGRQGCYTSYDALKSAFNELFEMAIEQNITIAIPYGLGCGLAGGNWNIVYDIIENVFNKRHEIISIYKLVK